MARIKIFISILLLAFIAACKSSPPANQANANQSQQRAAEARDEHGNPELKRAVDKNDTEAARRLIEGGADVNAGNLEGVTPLMNAAGMGNKEIVQMLIAKGADVNAKARGGDTALMTAARNGQTEMIKILLDAGADPDAKDNVISKTAAMWAEEKGHKDIVELLKQKSAERAGKK